MCEKTEIVKVVSEYEQQDCVEFIVDLLTILTPEQLKQVHLMVITDTRFH